MPKKPAKKPAKKSTPAEKPFRVYKRSFPSTLDRHAKPWQYASRTQHPTRRAAVAELNKLKRAALARCHSDRPAFALAIAGMDQTMVEREGYQESPWEYVD